MPSRVGAFPADAHAVHDHDAAVDELSTAGVYVSTPAVHSHESPSSLGVWPVGHCRQLSDEMSRYLSAAGQVGMGTESDWAETSGRSARIAANIARLVADVESWAAICAPPFPTFADMPKLLLADLPVDVVQHILVRLTVTPDGQHIISGASSSTSTTAPCCARSSTTTTG